MTERSFHRLQSRKLDDDAAEAVRRDHARAIVELQDIARELLAAPACIGLLHLSMSADQASPSANDVIAFDTVVANTAPGILRHSDSGTVSLSPGYTYRLSGAVMASGSGDAVQSQWYDVTNAAYVGTRGYAQANDISNTVGEQPAAAYVVAVGRNTDLTLNVQGVTSTPTMLSAHSFATVEVYRK